MKNFFLFLIIIPLISHSQENLEDRKKANKTKEDVVSILTNDDHKEWHFKETIIENGKCKQGQTFTFFKKDSTISIKRCKQGEWAYQNVNWLLKYRTTYDWLILLNEEKYHLIFKNYSEHQELILRPTMISNNTDKVDEIILIYDPDLKNQSEKPKKKKARAH